MSVYPNCASNNSLIRGFVGSIDPVGRRSCCIRDGGAVLVTHQGCGALVQEGPPLVFPVGVLLVRTWCWLPFYAAPASPVFALN
jgi:hypothetical protein